MPLPNSLAGSLRTSVSVKLVTIDLSAARFNGAATSILHVCDKQKFNVTKRMQKATKMYVTNKSLMLQM